MLLDILHIVQDFLVANKETFTSPWTLATLGLLGIYLVWRIWSFTISPRLFPHRVKELPYWIPFLGHGISFFRNPGAVVDAAARLAKGGLEPFAISICGKKLYFITNPSDVTESFRNVTSLSWDKYLDELLTCWGVKKDAVPLLHAENPKLATLFSTVTTNQHQRKDLYNFADLVFRRQLAVDKVDELSSVFFRTLNSTASWSQLECQSSSGKNIRLTVRGLLDCTLSRAITQMFFGDTIFKIEPAITEHTLAFSDGIWQLVYHYPKWLASDFYASYERVMVAIERFAESSPAEMKDACFMMKSMIEAERLSNFDARSSAALTSIMYLAAFANVHATSFWLLCYIIFNHDLNTAIRAEIAPAFKDGVFNTNYIVQHCPLLESSFREVLRLHIVSYSVRLIESPTHFSGKVLNPGNVLMVPFGRLHHNEAVWGSDHARFNPTRFLNSKGRNLANNPSYRPFGGGTNMCPGKAYANRQVLSFIAYMLHEYEITVPEINGRKQGMPLVQEDTPTFGTSVPRPGTEPLIELTPKGNEPVRSIISWSK